MNPAHDVLNEVNQPYTVNPFNVHGNPKPERQIKQERVAIYRHLMNHHPRSAQEARRMIVPLRAQLNGVRARNAAKGLGRMFQSPQIHELEMRIQSLQQTARLLNNPPPQYPPGHIFPLGIGAAHGQGAAHRQGVENNVSRRTKPSRKISNTNIENAPNGFTRLNYSHLQSQQKKAKKANNRYNSINPTENKEGNEEGNEEESENYGGAKRKTTKRKSTTTKRKSTTTKRKSTTRKH